MCHAANHYGKDILQIDNRRQSVLSGLLLSSLDIASI